MDTTCVCGKLFGTEAGLRTHVNRGRCRGPGRADDVCPICTKQYKSYSGMRQHFKRAHPVEYNSALEDKYEKAEEHDRVSPDRLLINMAEAEAAYNGRFVNKHLQQLFPELNYDRVKYLRKKEIYKQYFQDAKIKQGVDLMEERDQAQTDEVSELPPAMEAVVVEERIGAPQWQEAVMPDPVVETEGPLSEFKRSLREFVNSRSEELNTIEMRLMNMCQLADANAHVDSIGAALQEYAESLTAPAARARSETIKQRRPQTPRNNMNRAQRRSLLYRKAQQLYKFNKKELAKCIVNDLPWDEVSEGGPSVADAEREFGSVFGSLSREDLDPIVDQTLSWPDDNNFLITEKDILMALKSMRSDAAGPDGIKPSAIRRVRAHRLFILFNTILVSGIIPQSWKMSRTILVPKGGDPRAIGNWRPITISSAYLRLFNKILFKRLSSARLSRSQRGFRNIDGVLMNNLTLQSVIKSRRMNGLAYHILSLDLRKAFDTVSHHSVERALRRLCIPDLYINVIMNGYRDCATTISTKFGQTKSIRVNRGVKQGDPLSPLLFNMVLDELICELEKSNLGISVGDDARLAVMGYADDLVLVSDTIRHAQKLLNKAHEFFGRRGMALNPDKCNALSVNYNRGSKHLYQITRSVFYVEANPIRQLQADQVFGYLGRKYNSMGQSTPSISDIDLSLKRLGLAPLKSFQKMDILRTFLIPGWIDALQGLGVALKQLKQADRMVRNFVRRTLHLNKTCQEAYIHAPIKEGGLGILSFRSYIPLIMIGRINRLKNENTRLSASVLGLQHTKKLIERLSRWSGSLNSSRAIKNYYSSALEAGFSGNGLRQGSGREASGSWVTRPPAFWSAGDYNRAAQLRGNLLPTRGIPSNPPGERLCRAGCGRVESLSHVLQRCPLGKWMRIKRHNCVLDCLIKHAQAGGWNVAKEPRVRCPSGLLRLPDMVAVKGNDVLVVDVGVSWEGPEPLLMQAQHKRAIYEDPRFIDGVSRLYNVPNEQIKFCPLIIGARGIWDRVVNMPVSRALNLSKSAEREMVSRTVLGGVFIHKAFNRN